MEQSLQTELEVWRNRIPGPVRVAPEPPNPDISCGLRRHQAPPATAIPTFTFAQIPHKQDTDLRLGEIWVYVEFESGAKAVNGSPLQGA